MQSKYIQHILSLLFIIVLGIVTTSSLEKYMDILLWDEARYLDRGLWLWKAYPKDWGTTYSVWYKLLSYIENNRIELYYLNYKILSIGIVVLAYIVMIRLKTPTLLSFFFCLMLLIHQYNLTVWPKISHFCVAVILLAIVYASYFSSSIIKSVALAFAFLIIGYARPEMYLSFIISIPIILYLLIKKYKSITLTEKAHLAFLFLITTIIYILLKTPFNNGDSSRSVGVFFHHFALNYSLWQNDGTIFWYDWPEVIKKCFTEPYNFKTIFLNADSYFWKHILFNIQLSIKSITVLFFSLLFPIAFVKENILLFIICTIIVLSLIIKFKINWRNILYRIKNEKVLVLMLLVSTIPVLMSCIYAHPRTHYMIMLLPFAIFILINLFDNKKHIDYNNIYIVILFFIALFFFPKSKDFKYFDMFGTNDGLMNQKTIHYLESRFKKDSITIMDIDGSLSTMMSQNFTNINANKIFQDTNTHFSDMILRQQPDVVYITPTVLRLKLIQSDSLFQKMMLNPSQYNYIPQKTSNFKAYLWIKKPLQ